MYFTGCLRWNNPPDKTNLISARDNNNLEQLSDLNIPSAPSVSTFVLRDFVTTGDAVRIKLPHFNWQSLGDVKNQYLWLENHQLINRIDQNINFTLSNNNLCPTQTHTVCGPSWTTGIFAQIQVGKDQKYTTNVSDIYVDEYNDPQNFSNPNCLGSWLYPLTATGNFDYTYSPVITPPYDNCLFGNQIVYLDLSDPANTKENPFTGFSEVYGLPENSNSNYIFDGDKPLYGYIDNSGGFPTIHYENIEKGGPGTSFKCNGSCPTTGKEILSLSTNPSPVSIFTALSADNYNSYNQLNNLPWENRKIWLNGISVKISEENYTPSVFGPGAIKIEVKWDDYSVKNNVRWCADEIILSPNDFNNSNYSLELKTGVNILLDQGLSPTERGCFFRQVVNIV